MVDSSHICAVSVSVYLLDAGIQTSKFSQILRCSGPLYNVSLKLCWRYAMQPSFIINLSKITGALLNLYVHGMRPNLSLLHGMWMRLIGVAQVIQYMGGTLHWLFIILSSKWVLTHLLTDFRLFRVIEF